MRYVFSTVGTAAWAMTVILASGFLVLAFSAFELNSSKSYSVLSVTKLPPCRHCYRQRQNFTWQFIRLAPLEQ